MCTQKLGVESKNCLVVEDSVIGLLVSLPSTYPINKINPFDYERILFFNRQQKEQGCHV